LAIKHPRLDFFLWNSQAVFVCFAFFFASPFAPHLHSSRHYSEHVLRGCDSDVLTRKSIKLVAPDNRDN
jgi:hypothetical protein